jgi:hypothetical protein
MTLMQLIHLCETGYTKDFPESSLLAFVNQRQGTPLRMLPSPIGDTLALFIVRELGETYDADASDEGQIAEAIRVMEMARTNIENVINILRDRSGKHEP